ncbi:mannitol dehydrogenase family protein [Thioclava sp. A2]|uniref:mannitol dehydrogenase family protein n=1 Tax=Thioclava sp. FCG-A2 TaxID=3080562 RepID=UPI002955D476|nr:mannitol dehydrogenase family protein [Thioclava sp. A2]MDV7270038.1 mannitol dehydrogenase family protein [Thioclava sp. A2]
MSMKLSLETLDTLPEAVAKPAYDRSDLTPGILHFGVGNFHRAHQAVYLDRLFSKGLGRDFAIIGAGVMPADKKAREIMAAQDFLTLVVEQSADASDARVTGPMVDYIEPGQTARLIATMADPAIRIVSMTITEGGYFLDATDTFDPTHPAIQKDAANPDAPETVFGLIVAGLRARRAAGLAPFTVMSCDNIPHNGVVTRNAVCGVAKLIDGELAEWIAANVAFPNGMVDRITPATSDRERRLAAEEHGVADQWPIFCEDFIQWVLEDNFPAGRPPLEEAGVQFVADVTPFELMKIRILNGGHAVIAYPGGLLGIEFVHEAMEHPLIRAFLDKITEEEIRPVVPPVPDTDTKDYAALISHRFANPKIGDTERRLCLDGSNRQPKFIVPSIRDAIAKGGKFTGLALESALWCRYCYGTDEAGHEIAPNDPNWERLVPIAREAKSRPEAWLAQEAVYGTLGQNDAFRAAFATALNSLWKNGVEATLTTYLEDRL